MDEHVDPLAQRCRAIEMLVLDVDGVLTDGGIVYDDRGVEWKQFHVRDGSALKYWHRAGKRAVLISGRQSRAVDFRASDLGIALVIQGTPEKLAAYRRVLDQFQLRPEQMACVGHDQPDLPLIRNCGLGVAVRDAAAELRTDAAYVTQTPGGRGAVREVIEMILRCQGTWQRLVERLQNERLEGGG